MTLGEKIKEARAAGGLTQEELASKLMVSRQAVTKWETDKGIPDVENLKLISNLLGISVDYLLDDKERLEKSIIRESITLSQYGRKRKKVIKDKVVREKYPNAVIHTLMGIQKNTKQEKIIDNLVGFLTDAPFGIPNIINNVKNIDKEFYLVLKGDKQFFVIVTDEFIESRQMVHKVINQKNEKFEIDHFQFTNCGPIVDA